MQRKILAGTWAVACSSMSMFTLLPAIKTENISMMYVLFFSDPHKWISQMTGKTLRLSLFQCCGYVLILLHARRLAGGFLMVLVGVLYILFEKSILSSTTETTQASLDGLSATLLGVQIGLIILSMIVTRSSVASLQAKMGLPLGNQVVGWMILSTQNIYNSIAGSTLTISQSRPCPSPSSMVSNQTTTTCTDSSSSSSPSHQSSSS